MNSGVPFCQCCVPGRNSAFKMKPSRPIYPNMGAKPSCPLYVLPQPSFCVFELSIGDTSRLTGTYWAIDVLIVVHFLSLISLIAEAFISSVAGPK